MNPLNLIPLPYRLLIYAGLITALIIFTWNKGYQTAVDKYIAEQAKAVKVEQKKQVASNEVTQKVVTVYVDKVRTLEKKVYVYREKAKDTIKDSDNHVVPADTISLLDSTVNAANGDAESTGVANVGAEKAQVDLRTFVDTTIENYGICGEIRTNLIDLQGWIRSQEKIYPAK